MKRDFKTSNVVANLLSDPPTRQPGEAEDRESGTVEVRKTEKKAEKPARQPAPPKTAKSESPKKTIRKEFYFSPDLVEKIEGYALEEGETEADVARTIFEEFFARKKYEVSPAIAKMLAKKREKKAAR